MTTGYFIGKTDLSGGSEILKVHEQEITFKSYLLRLHNVVEKHSFTSSRENEKP